MSVTPEVQQTPLRARASRIIKLFVSGCVFACDQIWLYCCRVLQIQREPRWVVLYYHSVPDSYVRRFEEQMRLASQLAIPLDLLHIGDLSESKVSISVTFDDALESFPKNAVPILTRLKIPATVFVASEALGTRPRWVEFYSNEIIMSSKDLAELPDLISVGSHTLTHANLVLESDVRVRQEISDSRRNLENIVRRPVTLFSFPFGSFNDSLVQQCRQAGYARVFTTEPNYGRLKNFVVGRVSADPWDWRLEFFLKVMGAYRWLAVVSAIRGAAKRLAQLGFRTHTPSAQRNVREDA